MQHSNFSENNEFQDDEIDIADILLILWKRRLIIIGMFLLAISLSFLQTLSRPRNYRSTTTILNMLDRQVVRRARGIDFNTLVKSPQNIILTAILNSDSLAREVVNTGDLLPELFPKRWDKTKKIWKEKTGKKPPTVKKGIKRLKGMVKIKTPGKSSIIAITVMSKDAALSAKIANKYTEALDAYLKNNTFSAVKKSRLFLEKQLEKTKKHLDSLKNKLESFQTTNGIIDLKKQIEVSMQAYNKNALLLYEYETKLELLKSISSLHNPQVINLSKRIDAIKKRLLILKEPSESLRNSEQTTAIAVPGDELNNNYAFIHLNKIPHLKMQQARLLKEIEIQQKLYDLIVDSYEKITIQEAKDAIYITVLDKASVPDKPVGTGRRKIILLGGVAGLFMGIFLVFAMEFIVVLKYRLKEKSALLQLKKEG